MITRLKESPAFRKLFRNRPAVIAVGVIAFYLAVFVWILAMQLTAWIGIKTGSYDLRDRPILGALLPSSTLDRAGARNMPGFGLIAEPEKRGEHLRFYFDQAGQAIQELETAETDENISVEDTRRRYSFSERRLAELPREQLAEIHAEGEAIFAQQGILRGLRANLLKVELAATNARQNADSFAAAEPDSEDAEVALEEVAFSLEEIGFLIEDIMDQIPPEAPLAKLDPDAFFDAAEAVMDQPDPLFDPVLVDEAFSAAEERYAVITDEINAKITGIEPLVEQLYPLPTGTPGFVYKVRLMLGTDRQGRSILIRALYSAKVAIQVGLVVSVVAVLFGSLIGAAAGYFGSFTDHIVIWFYSTFSSIPYLVLLVVLAFMFTGSAFEGTLIPLYVAFCLTYWIGPCRVTRGEALKLKSLDYVQAANALGAGRMRILTRHIIPNTAHLMFINLSLLFIGAIKGEVVLTFLGLGLKDGASWGIMINQSKSEVVNGFFWQIGAATFFMFVLVFAFNILTDALQDAFDPKHVG